MKKIVKMKILFLIIIPITFSGCWDQAPVQSTGYMTIVGIESSPLGEMKVTYAMPVIDPTAKARGELIDTEAPLTREARENSNRRAGKLMLAGKIQLVFFSEEIAEKGVISQINSIFERDPSDPILAWNVVVDGSPRDFIHGVEALQDKPRPSTYLNALLERAVSDGFTIDSRVFHYDIIDMAPGIDNVVPLIKLNSKAAEVKGSALFSSGKMVGTINTRESGLLAAMMKTLKGKKYTYEVSDINDEDNEKPIHGLAVLLIQKSNKINVSIKDNKVIVNIDLKFNGTVDDYKFDGLSDEDKIKELNKHIELQIQSDCQKLIEHLQSLESDPIGIGDIVRAKYNGYWKRCNWHEAYKNAAINVHVKFNIVQYGAIK
ncbi:MAG: Ger(x)C family spore germination protein [Bacillota bacterium]|nr:Ger(x)C family spore germination protein [Bacillota bacterium]